MDVTNRLQEATKQIRLAKQEVEDPEVNQELERALESLQDGLESFDKES